MGVLEKGRVAKTRKNGGAMAKGKLIYRNKHTLGGDSRILGARKRGVFEGWRQAKTTMGKSGVHLTHQRGHIKRFEKKICWIKVRWSYLVHRTGSQ